MFCLHLALIILLVHKVSSNTLPNSGPQIQIEYDAIHDLLKRLYPDCDDTIIYCPNEDSEISQQSQVGQEELIKPSPSIDGQNVYQHPYRQTLQNQQDHHDTREQTLPPRQAVQNADRRFVQEIPGQPVYSQNVYGISPREQEVYLDNFSQISRDTRGFSRNSPRLAQSVQNADRRPVQGIPEQPQYLQRSPQREQELYLENFSKTSHDLREFPQNSPQLVQSVQNADRRPVQGIPEQPQYLHGSPQREQELYLEDFSKTSHDLREFPQNSPRLPQSVKNADRGPAKEISDQPVYPPYLYRVSSREQEEYLEDFSKIPRDWLLQYDNRPKPVISVQNTPQIPDLQSTDLNNNKLMKSNQQVPENVSQKIQTVLQGLFGMPQEEIEFPVEPPMQQDGYLFPSQVPQQREEQVDFQRPYYYLPPYSPQPSLSTKDTETPAQDQVKKTRKIQTGPISVVKVGPESTLT